MRFRWFYLFSIDFQLFYFQTKIIKPSCSCMPDWTFFLYLRFYYILINKFLFTQILIQCAVYLFFLFLSVTKYQKLLKSRLDKIDGFQLPSQIFHLPPIPEGAIHAYSFSLAEGVRWRVNYYLFIFFIFFFAHFYSHFWRSLHMWLLFFFQLIVTQDSIFLRL